MPGTTYPFGDLSGSGVAFKVMWALCQKATGATKVTPQFREFLVDSVVLAALGMIADVVPLHDENRIFVRQGLARLRETNSPGLKALLEACGMLGKADLCAADIGFGLAPRLNAAGRLGCARLVVELLTTSAPVRAGELARFLDGQNQQRQTIERRILAEARERLEGQDLDATPAIVLADAELAFGRDRHRGGPAGRAVRPADADDRDLQRDRDRPGLRPLRGRLPAAPGPDACSEGAPQPRRPRGGGRLQDPGRPCRWLPRAILRVFAHQHFNGTPPPPRLVLDAEVPLSAVTPGLLNALARLEPYGAGNPRPLLMAGPVQIVGEARKVGGGERHVRLRVRQQGTTIPAIAFGLGERFDELLSAEGWCTIAFTPSFNDWQGMRTVQLEIRDFQPGKEARLG